MWVEAGFGGWEYRSKTGETLFTLWFNRDTGVWDCEGRTASLSGLVSSDRAWVPAEAKEWAFGVYQRGELV